MNEEEQGIGYPMMITSSFSYPDWANFVTAWIKALKPYHIHPGMTFLPELILLVGGVDIRLAVSSTSFGPLAGNRNVQITTKVSEDILHTVAGNLALRHDYPPIAARVFQDVDGKALGIFFFSASTLTTHLIPSLDNLKNQHPNFFERHQNSSAGLNLRLQEVLSKYLISSHETDAMEETTLALVQRSVRVKFITYRQYILHFYNGSVLENGRVLRPLPADTIHKILDFLVAPANDISAELNTTISVLQDHPTDLSYTQMCTTVPLDKIKYVENYFNEFNPKSAYANPEQENNPHKDNALLTVLNIKHSTLFQPRFLKRFEEVLYADESKKLDSYQYDTHAYQLEKPDAPNTAARIAELETVKRDLLARNSIFTNHLQRIQLSLKPWLDVITAKADESNRPDIDSDANSDAMSDARGSAYSNDSDLTEKRRRLK
jgi:hypothetical protein